MQPSHDPGKDLALRYRAAIDPSPAHVEHERTRLMARIAAEVLREDHRPKRLRQALHFGAVAAGLSLFVAGLGLYIDLRVQQAVASLALRQTETRARPPAIAPGAPRECDMALAPAAPPGDSLVRGGTSDEAPAPEGAALALPLDRAGPPASAVLGPTTARANAPHRRAAPLDADALVQESSLLSQARLAQGRGDWRAVLDLADEHRRSYSQGALEEERLVLEAAAACNAGQRARGLKAARALLRRFPRSLALRRVSDLCDGTDHE